MLEKYILNKYATNNQQSREKIGEIASMTGISLNLALFLLKVIAGLVSSSIAIISDAINNLSDAASAIVTLVGFRLAKAPAHKEHPFGHGRMEYIAGLIVSMIIILMGFELAKEAVSKIINPQQLVFSKLSMAIIFIAIIVKLWMGFFYKKLANGINSPTLVALSKDSFSDVIATTVVGIGLIIYQVFNLNIDSWLGLVVAGVVLYNGMSAAKQTLSPLLGEASSAEMLKEIEDTALSIPEITGLHDLLVHNYGPNNSIISFHAEVNANCDIITAHECIDLLEQQIKHKFNMLAVIHLDPIMLDDELTNKVQNEIAIAINNMDERLKLHDFRVVKGANRLNIIFDLVVPFEIQADDEAIWEDVVNTIQLLDNNYCPVIHIERN